MLPLDGKTLTLDGLEAIAHRGATVALSTDARERIRHARSVVDLAVRERRVVYGITTGFGNFADVVIPHERLLELQENLVRSHAAGVGEPLGDPETRALMALRINVLARGRSGARLDTVEALVALLNASVLPVIPSQGSVGASGDLAPLAHLALTLIGEGEAVVDGQRLPSADALRLRGLSPVTLQAKEGLALINGTQLTTAVGALALAEAHRLLLQADIIAALSLDALHGTNVAFDPRIHEERPHPGQRISAANLRQLLEASAIRESHRDCGKVQDAYALRCIPQVHGAARDAVAYVTATYVIEMNSATDNPMVFAETGEILSGGNFHGQPVAIAADVLTIAMAEIGAISERRTERLVNPTLSSLPAFLTRDGGLNSGLMMAQVTAAALASESKALSHPASVDSIPTSAGKEDHVSMGPVAARKAAQVVRNTRRILAVELLAACQAIEFRRPLRTSDALEAVHACVRRVVPALERDRPLAPDIEAVARLLAEGAIARAAAGHCPGLD